jgi:hypothetical protein
VAAATKATTSEQAAARSGYRIGKGVPRETARAAAIKV